MLVLGVATLLLFLDQWNILRYDIGAISGSFQCWFICNNDGQSRFRPSVSSGSVHHYSSSFLLLDSNGNDIYFYSNPYVLLRRVSWLAIEETFHLWRVAKLPWRCRAINVSSWAQLFEGRLALYPGLNLTSVSFSFVQKHFLGQFSRIFIEHRIINLLAKRIKLNLLYKLS